MTNQLDYVTLHLSGELDANSSIDIDEQIAALLSEGKVRLHISAKDLTYISSAGLGVFVSHLDEIHHKKGKMVFSQMRENVKNVFGLLGLDKIIKIVNTEAEAAEILKA